MSVDVEVRGGARDGDTITMRSLIAFLVDGRWHLYEAKHEDDGTLQYVGVVDETPAKEPLIGN